ncbi:MAG: protoheme IX farnesyltransferase [Bacteroidetes bacterium]|nr:protoheme IX farnesyltransferase [Bacteroidota bacterium]
MLSFASRIFPELIRIRVSLSVTLSAFAAWCAASGTVSPKAIVPLAGIFLLASGASAFNQVQEKEQDAKMERTKHRPVPSGKISSKNASFFAFLLLLSGLTFLASGAFWTCVVLGLLNILWYNGFYTWLKKKTAFAVVPGALSGVIPVYMGWSAAGGSLSDHPVFLLAFFLFMWQIPHFWLLMIKYGNEYRLAGFPVMTDVFNEFQFRNIIFAWMIGATGTSLLLVLSGFWMLLFSKLMIPGMNLIILSLFFYQFYFVKIPRYKLLFILMNTFLLLVLLMLILEKTIS